MQNFKKSILFILFLLHVCNSVLISSSANEAVKNLSIIKNASYYKKVRNSTTLKHEKVIFYTFDGDELLATKEKKYLKDPELYLDINAPKPQPTYYEIVEKQYQKVYSLWLETHYIIIFYDKNNNNIASYSYNSTAEQIEHVWNPIEKKYINFSFPAHKFCINLGTLNNFPLDLSKARETLKSRVYRHQWRLILIALGITFLLERQQNNTIEELTSDISRELFGN